MESEILPSLGTDQRSVSGAKKFCVKDQTHRPKICSEGGKACVTNLICKVSKEYQTLNVIISSGRSREFLGRDISVKDLDVMDRDKVEAYYKIYELNYANKINENIISSIIGAYAKAVNRVLPIDDVRELERDLNNDYILTNELKNITGSVAATCGKFMSVFSLSFITFKHIRVQASQLVTHTEGVLQRRNSKSLVCDTDSKSLVFDKEHCKELVKEQSSDDSVAKEQ